MMLNQRDVIVLKERDIERAARMFEQEGEYGDNAIMRSFYEGAGLVLDILATRDVKSCDDLLGIFDRTAFEIESKKGTK